MNKLFLFLFSLFLPFPGTAADIQRIGVPYVQNYSKILYEAGNQNWSIVKGKDGVMYFGNAEGLLAFDGKYWQLHQMPNRLIVRAVATDGTGKIFAGGFGEFGYWADDKNRLLAYHSLSKLLPVQDEIKDEVWKIYIDGERVLFQSFAAIYIYEKGKISVVKGDQPFLFLFKAKNRFFVEIISKGLYELKGKTLHYIEQSNRLGNSGILSVLPFKAGSYLIGTAKEGLFIYDGKSIMPWANQGNDFLKINQMNNGAFILGKYFAYGTILNGMIILDESGNVIQRINKKSGLQNNTVLSIFTDNEQNLWAGLDNGIDRIEINSPLYFHFDKTGLFGTVYSSIIYQNKIYLGTNQGLFYSDWSATNARLFQSLDFKFINQSQGQVWDLSVIDGQLLCGHNNGTYAVEGNKLKKISATNGGWTIKPLNSNPRLLIQGTYTGLAVYDKDPLGNWKYARKINHFGEPSRYVEQDSKGFIWVSHAYKGIYKLDLSDDLKDVKSNKYYDRKDGLPDNYHINIFALKDRIVFSSDSGFYFYDDITDRFFPYEQLNKKLGSFASSGKIISATGEKYWFIKHGRVAMVDLSEPGKLYIDSTRFSTLNGRMVQYYENISRINSSIYLISVDDGFAIFNTLNAYSQDDTVIPNVLIRKVENITGKIVTLTDGRADHKTQIAYEKNNIRFTFALPFYRQSDIKFQYLLSGYSKQWSDWNSQAQKEFTNLGAGNYFFLVRARVNEKYLSKTTSFSFKVLPPWYTSRLAVLCYVALALCSFFLFRHLYWLKLKKHREHIQQKLRTEHELLLRQEAIANNQRISNLKNEQLRADLVSKNRELANSAMNTIYKNELLQKINDEMLRLKDRSGNELSAEHFKKIQKVIDEGKSDERDWNLFESSFNEAHENFFKKLKNGNPELTPNDSKLCGYLRMNMNSKEIASLLNITVRGVEIRRYRLRKKLNVSHDKNLVAFLMEL
ncbi:MAG: triple tyrosine motif-containing protein [Sphingobacteriaceae bacterium]